MIRFAARTAALPLLALLLAAPAAAQDAPTSSHLMLSAGLDYRYVYTHFYIYGGGYWEKESTTAAVAGEVAWAFPIGSKVTLAPGLGLTAGTASSKIWGSGSISGGETVSGGAYRVEVYGEGAFEIAPRLALVARAGYGASVVDSGGAGDWLRAGLAAAGLRYWFTRSLGLTVLYQTSFAPDGSTDVSAPYEPSFENGNTWAVSARLCWRR